MTKTDLPAHVVSRKAVVYVRQSTLAQVEQNLESQRRQYALADLAREYGFREVLTIDDDLGRSAGGTAERPGFQALVAQLCAGTVGAVFCLEASRLARNGRDWHHLLELCGLVAARVIDPEGVYDPGHPNDRLLLGLKGTMSEFELTVIRRRLIEGALAKAKRGELRLTAPVGFTWPQDSGVELDPDLRIQEAVRFIFRQFERLGSARQVLLQMKRDGILFPRPKDVWRMTDLEWRAPAYRNVISVLVNPFYAGAYAYGKSEPRTTLVEGRLRRSYGHARPMPQWTVLIRDHHPGYISWEEYERNQERLRRNTFCKSAGGAKSARGGRALLSGMVRCRRCGRMMQVSYCGYKGRLVRYVCKGGNSTYGVAPCISFGAIGPDATVAAQLLRAVQPAAIEAAIMAEREASEALDERRRALELERQQAEYEVRLARRRYEAVDPDNRLVARELEGRWNTALGRLRDCEQRLATEVSSPPKAPSRDELLTLARDLEAVWKSPNADARAKQRLVRALIEEVVADVDDQRHEVVLTIHWRGGQHSEVRVRKLQPGEHRNRAPKEAADLIREMATKWSDEHVAATLNRMGLRTGQGQTWTARRVSGYRMKHGIHGYASAVKDGKCLTMVEAAKAMGVSAPVVRRLIAQGILPAQQVVKDAPWQILAEDLKRPEVKKALENRRSKSGGPCRQERDTRTLRIPGT